MVIGGSYDGTMRAGSIWATQTAQIAGEIHYQSLQMDRGAALNCRVVHNWEDEGVRVEKARWGRHTIIKGKQKVELQKTIDVSEMTLTQAMSYLEKQKPKKKKRTKKK